MSGEHGDLAPPADDPQPPTPPTPGTMSSEHGDLTPLELDDLASAYLDGEATPEESALVEGDPHMQALMEELRAVQDLVAAPVEVPSDEIRDQMIARALDHRAPVVSLGTARQRLRAIPSQARVILAAAAVVAALVLVGVTVLERQGGEFAGDDDMASAPVMADVPADAPADAEPDVPADAPADAEPDVPADVPADAEPEARASVPAADVESLEVAEESAPTDEAVAAEVFAAEAPAEEAGDGEMAVQLGEAPNDDGYADDGYADDASAHDSGEPQPMMADALEVAPTSAEAALVFETSADLADHAPLLAKALVVAQDAERLDEATDVDLMGCPLVPDEDLELLARFDALVAEVDVQVSVYATKTDLQLTETTPPPECELLNSHIFLDWLE